MLVFVVIAVLFAAAVFIVANLIAKQKKQKALAAQRARFNEQVREIQSTFKIKLDSLLELEVIEKKEKQRIYTIANNFFVFQPVNELNLKQLNQLLDNFMTTLGADIGSELEQFEESRLKAAKPLLITFAMDLPLSARDYNPEFYNDKLPRLIFEFAEAVDNRLKLQQSLLEQEGESAEQATAESVQKECAASTETEAEPS